MTAEGFAHVTCHLTLYTWLIICMIIRGDTYYFLNFLFIFTHYLDDDDDDTVPTNACNDNTVPPAQDSDVPTHVNNDIAVLTDSNTVPTDVQSTPPSSSFQSASSPSYSPLEHVVPSDSDSDEELPSFNIGEL